MSEQQDEKRHGAGAVVVDEYIDVRCTALALAFKIHPSHALGAFVKTAWTLANEAHSQMEVDRLVSIHFGQPIPIDYLLELGLAEDREGLVVLPIECLSPKEDVV